jgi:hypothetical protein
MTDEERMKHYLGKRYPDGKLTAKQNQRAKKKRGKAARRLDGDYRDAMRSKS